MDRLIILQTANRVQVSTASSVACLRAWGRLPDGQDRSGCSICRCSSFPARKFGCARVGPLQGRQNSIFLKDYDGNTRVIRCHGYDLIHDVVEFDGWDIYVTLHGLSGTLLGEGLSDNDTIRVCCRLRGGSNNTDILGQWQCGKLCCNALLASAT